jgi:hypothetical protein
MQPWLVAIIVVLIVLIVIYAATRPVSAHPVRRRPALGRRHAAAPPSSPVTIPIQHYKINPDGSVEALGVPSPQVQASELKGRKITLVLAKFGTAITTVVAAADDSGGKVNVMTTPNTLLPQFAAVYTGAAGDVATIA